MKRGCYWILVSVLSLVFTQCTQSEVVKTLDEQTQDVRFAGNIRMSKLLDSLSAVASIHTNYYLSGKRAAYMLQQKPQFKNLRESVIWHTKYALELLNSGNAYGAISVLEEMLDGIEGTQDEKIKRPLLKVTYETLAVCYLRLGEDDNCIANHNDESCIVPLSKNAIHTKRKGSEMARSIYLGLLQNFPDDYQTKWLFNIACMTLGMYPHDVPKEFFIDFGALEPQNIKFNALQNRATALGVDVGGLSGAGIVEDFNNDGYSDIFCSSYGIKDPVKLFLADGKGGFTDATKSSQLHYISGGLNAKQADFNNDGFIDILLLRGAWLDEGGEWPNSLLRNNGDGTFSDVTFEAGMGTHFYPTETATWADVNNDGWVDVFIANENNAKNAHPCELFVNNGDGTFTDKAKAWGMAGNFGYAKAANFADFNSDGWMDLFLGCLGQENYVFMNRGKSENGDIKFENIAKKAGLTKPLMSFPAIVEDFDHNGFPDILTTSFPMDRLDHVAEDVAKEILGISDKVEKTKLFLNYGNERFVDVSKSWGIDKMIYAMGLNSGDLNNDGFIDIYAGTGAFAFTTLVPNRVFLNNQGKGFVEVTTKSGMGHLQKGHGVGFGDLDNDGDQDVYITLGGAVEGDDAHNALFINTNESKNWIRLKLVGKKYSNTLGARVKLTLIKNNQQVVRYFTVGAGGTFGSNSQDLEIGLGDFEKIDNIEVRWPGRAVEVFKGFKHNSAYQLEEGKPNPKVLKLNPMPLMLSKVGTNAACCDKE